MYSPFEFCFSHRLHSVRIMVGISYIICYVVVLHRYVDIVNNLPEITDNVFLMITDDDKRKAKFLSSYFDGFLLFVTLHPTSHFLGQ